MRQNGISEYRAELMAISMFAILLTHLKASFGVYALDRVALLCQGGVDVFLFLSGFGLYYSGMKSDNPLRFYSKRFKRIFPSFWVVMLLTFWLIDKLHWPNVLWGGSTLAFWFQSTNKLLWLVCVVDICALCRVPVVLPFVSQASKNRHVVWCRGWLAVNGDVRVSLSSGLSRRAESFYPPSGESCDILLRSVWRSLAGDRKRDIGNGEA